MGTSRAQYRPGQFPEPVTFDAGALIAVERGDARVRAMARVLADDGVPILVRAPVVAEVWRGGVGRQARLTQFLGTGLRHDHIRIVALTFEVARELGMILARAHVHR